MKNETTLPVKFPQSVKLIEISIRADPDKGIVSYITLREPTGEHKLEITAANIDEALVASHLAVIRRLNKLVPTK